MRERWAMGLALATSVIVLVLAAVFAIILNRPREPVAADAVPASADAVPAAQDGALAQEQISRGREVFARENCSGCHSVAGEGSPRSPLDGVGNRRARGELHDWVVADESVHPELPSRAIAAKQRYVELSSADMDALLSYLDSLRE